MHLASIKTALKPVKTLRQTLMKVKTCIPEENRRGFVNEVPCKDCMKTYVRETKKTLKKARRAQASSEEM